MSWRSEFMHHPVDYDVPARIEELEGVEDMSWHNDVCPSFGREISDSLRLRIWCDTPEADDRECPGEGRFTILADAWDERAWDLLRDADLEHLTMEFPASATTPVPDLTTDDPDVAIRIFMLALLHLQAAARRSTAPCPS